MKKNNKVIMSLCLMSLLSSCAPQPNNVSLYFYNSEDTFIQSLANNIEDNFHQGNITYSKYDASLSQTKQNEQIIEEIDNDLSNILAVNTVDRLAASSIIAKAQKKKKPVIFFNREPISEDLSNFDNCYYVGSDPVNEGRLQASMSSSLFGNPENLNSKYDKNGDNIIQLVVIKGEQGHQDMENRTKYCIQGLQDLGYQVDVINSAYCNWDRSLAYNAMQEMYDDVISKVELVLSNNDDMAMGVIDYLLERGDYSTEKDILEQPFPIIGVDGTSVGLTGIKNNLLYGTIQNDASNQAKAITAFVNYFIEGAKIDDNFPYYINSNHAVYIKGKVITKSSL